MPSSMADFESDPRIHYNTVSGKWEIEDDDGNEMEWDPLKNAWIPIVSFVWPETPVFDTDLIFRWMKSCSGSSKQYIA